MKKIHAGVEYLLHWRNNPNTWNEDLETLKFNNRVEKINKRYYTRVVAHFTGNFAVVDCTCNERTGDFYSINTSNLKEI